MLCNELFTNVGFSRPAAALAISHMRSAPPPAFRKILMGFPHLIILATIVITMFASAVPVTAQVNGLPVIRIDTKDGAPVLDRENYVNMTFTLTDPDNPGNNLSVVNNADGIRGRGNSTWKQPKKPYRIKFDRKQSLFGLPAARSWILLAEYYDPTLIKNAVAFELGDRLGLQYNHTYHHVELYLNDEYMGLYTLTEQTQTGKGRVDIDEENGWLVELDWRYKEDPKFRTTNYNLPVTIKSPEIEPFSITNPSYDFVKNDWDELTGLMASASFPENGYRDLIDMESITKYLLVPVLMANADDFIRDEMGSVFFYKNKDEKICGGPLWDFDLSLGSTNGSTKNGSPFYNPYAAASLFLGRFFQDPMFRAIYKETWHNNFSDISSISQFIDDISNKIRKSAEENYKVWRKDLDYDYWIEYTKDFINTRISFLDSVYNGVDVLPTNKTFTTRVFGYSEEGIFPQTFTFVSYGDMTNLSATFQKAELSGFEISTELNKTPTGNGGYLATISVKPKNSLSAAAYTDTLILSGTNQSKQFEAKCAIEFTVIQPTAVQSLDRVVPTVKPNEEATVIAPVSQLDGKFTAGPNPVAKPAGNIGFFRQGKRVADCKLRIYDVTGNVVNKVAITDKAFGSQARRQVGSWNLKDRNGRPVSEGTYLVKGVLIASDWKKEKVSLILSVR